MCAAVDSESNKKKMKQKTMFGYWNDIFNRKSPSSSKSMLKTDAVPLDNTSLEIASNGTEPNNENGSHSLNIPSRNTPVDQRHSMQMIQNNLNQANQTLTVVEQQQNLHFNNIHGLQIGNTYHVSGSSTRKNSYNGSYEDKANSKKTRSLIELMNCNDPIEMQSMRITARGIGENWRMVFRDLNMGDAEISQIHEQYYHISVEEIIYQLLLRWQRSSDDPSLGKLTTTLWQNRHHECVAELKKYFKKCKKSQTNGATESSENDSNGKTSCDRESD